ncbi:MAG: type II secretion system protein, partial [Pirellulaceae bacterium]
MSSNVRLSPGRPRNGLNRAGLTLVEMLVATALTLILFGAVAEMFARMGASVNDARSTIELSGNLRSAGNHLRRDLGNVSVKVGPWVYPGSNQGYFQIIEGPDRDIDYASKLVGPVPAAGEPFPGSLAGDADDIVSFTAYSKEKPFVGLIQGHLESIPPAAGSAFKYTLNTSNTNEFTVITSHYAEVVYFTKLTRFDDR